MRRLLYFLTPVRFKDCHCFREWWIRHISTSPIQATLMWIRLAEKIPLDEELLIKLCGYQTIFSATNGFNGSWSRIVHDIFQPFVSSGSFWIVIDVIFWNKRAPVIYRIWIDNAQWGYVQSKKEGKQLGSETIRWGEDSGQQIVCYCGWIDVGLRSLAYSPNCNTNFM